MEVAIIVISSLIVLFELVMFVFLLTKIFKFHTLTLKDTFIFPVIVLFFTVLVFIININYNDIFKWENCPEDFVSRLKIIFGNVFTSFMSSADVIKVSFKSDYIELLKQAISETNEPLSVLFGRINIYKEHFLIGAYYSSYTLSATALVSFSISIIKATVGSWVKNWIKFLFRWEQCFVFGFNKDGQNFIKNLSREEKRKTTVILNSSILNKYTDEKFFIEQNKVSYKLRKYSLEKEIIRTLKQLTWLSFLGKKFKIVTFFDDEGSNIMFVSAAKKFIKECKLQSGFYKEDVNDEKVPLNSIVEVAFKNDIKPDEEYKYISDISYGAGKPICVYEKQDKKEITQRFIFRINRCAKIKYKYEIVKQDRNNEFHKTLRKDSIYQIDHKLFHKVDSIFKTKIKFENDICKPDNCTISLIKLDKPKDITFTISCNESQQAIIDELIVNKIENIEPENTRKYINSKWSETNIVDQCYGLIRTFNKYDVISFDFMCKHSFAAHIQDYLYESKIKTIYDYLSKNGKNQDKNRLLDEAKNIVDSFAEGKESVHLEIELKDKQDEFTKQEYNKMVYEFLDFDEDDLSIRDNCDINLFVLGFGPVNQSVARDILINNQFFTKEKTTIDGKVKYYLKPKRINTWIYDNKPKLVSSSFSNGFLKYSRFKNEANPCHYHELPESFIDDSRLKPSTDINEKYFINKIYDEINDKVKENRHQYNFFLVSFDIDSTNWYHANVLRESLLDLEKRQKNGCKNFFFVRTQEYQRAYYDDDFFEKKNIYPFAIEYTNLKRTDLSDNAALSYKNVVKDNAYKIAKKIHFLYELMGDFTLKISDKKLNEMINDDFYTSDNWKFLSLIKQRSNIYSASSIFSKLSLAGVINHNQYLNYRKFTAFKNKYFKESNKPEELIDFKNYIYRDQSPFPVADTLAFFEHERWNAFEMCCGVLPMKKENVQKKTENDFFCFITKTSNEMNHLNLATEKGLVEYLDDVIKCNETELGEEFNKRKEEIKNSANVIKYDYHLCNYLLKFIEESENELKNNDSNIEDYKINYIIERENKKRKNR